MAVKMKIQCIVRDCFDIKERWRSPYCASHRAARNRYGVADDPEPRPCEQCGSDFFSRRKAQRFCSASCRDSWWTLERSTVHRDAS